MFSSFILNASQRASPKEGDIYKDVTIYGQTFRLFYGYYEDFERSADGNEPMPIYPDFIKNPVFTAEGIPFATAMQDICEHYDGGKKGDCCMECKHFKSCEELFGICKCDQRKLSNLFIPERSKKA